MPISVHDARTRHQPRAHPGVGIDRSGTNLYVAVPTRSSPALVAIHVHAVTTPARRPPPLSAAARIALIAPAGPLRDHDELDRAIDNVRVLGWEPVCGASVLVRQRYLAGEDELRAADLNAALRDPTIDGIWCLRGGYGSMRLLDAIDYAALARHPKTVLGYSDITALHAAMRRHAGVITFHAPTARTELTPFTRASLERAVRGTGEPCGHAPAARVVRGGRVSGPLVGGNLALVAALVGTPYAVNTEGALLVLEDVKEQVYRLDRLLRQLHLSGALARCAGLVLGAFTERGDGEDDGDDALEALLAETAAMVTGPVLAGVPIGHIDDQWTVPLGAIAALDADAKTLSIMASETS